MICALCGAPLVCLDDAWMHADRSHAWGHDAFPESTVNNKLWCGECRDFFRVNHHQAESGRHFAGPAFGSVGKQLQEQQILRCVEGRCDHPEDHLADDDAEIAPARTPSSVSGPQP